MYILLLLLLFKKTPYDELIIERITCGYQLVI